jgi:hypothetical protein
MKILRTSTRDRRQGAAVMLALVVGWHSYEVQRGGADPARLRDAIVAGIDAAIAYYGDGDDGVLH